VNPEPISQDRLVHGTLRAIVVVIGAAIALSTVYVAPRLGSQGGSNPAGSAVGATNDTSSTDQGATGGGAAPAQAGGGGSGGVAGGAGGGAKPGAAGAQPHGGPAGLSCPKNNGGKTDIGVDGGNVYLAATEVESGIGSSFLLPVRYGMLAVVQKVNRSGGICGRQLQLTLKDDAWDATRGKEYLDTFISENYFALAVVPSSEGLNNASGGGDIDSAPDPVNGGQGIPVVGSDGMLNSQYTDPWIWPVAASTATSMRVMEHDAFKRGARTLGLVYNGSYKFGVEGAGAFVAQAKRDGAKVACIEKLDASQNDYSNQVNEFNKACGKQGPNGGVDFVALLLEPQTAETWLGSGSGPYLGNRDNGSGYGAGGPQPLFDYNFGNTCGATCANLEVWTSFYPPIYPYDQRPEVQTFKHDLCTADPKDCNVDADSAFTEGGYVGMQLLVQALQQTSPYLTRQGLRQTLDAMTLRTGLSADLTFRKGGHNANKSMVAFRDQYGQQFTGFQIVNGSQQDDPCGSCQDPPLS
jgi:ABC-type branched-subunit amino acid transport system substrate-binding protein